MSPALLFKQADFNKNGKIDIMELKQILMDISEKLNAKMKFDDFVLKQIMNELDVNGNGQLEEQEFYQLVKLSRASSTEGQSNKVSQFTQPV